MSNDNVKQNDLQIFQLGQVSEGPFFNNPQTVDILHWTAGIKMRKNVSVVQYCRQWLSTNKHSKACWHISRSESQGLNTPLCNWETNPVKLQWNAKRIPAVQMNNCFRRAVWKLTCGGRYNVSLTFGPGCGGRGRHVSVSAWCSRSGKSHCGTKKWLHISQQINKRPASKLLLKRLRSTSKYGSSVTQIWRATQVMDLFPFPSVRLF